MMVKKDKLGSPWRSAKLWGPSFCALFALLGCSEDDGQPASGLDAGSGGRNTGGQDAGTGGKDASVGGTGGSGASAASGGSAGTTGGSAGSNNTAGNGAGGIAGGGGVGGCVTADPDCECVEGVVVAKDLDNDDHGTRACEKAPGDDCNDDDMAFVQNVCGGCEILGGNPGGPCGDCGEYECADEDTLVCADPMPLPRECTNATTARVCEMGNWVVQACGGNTPVCLDGRCVACTPGEFKCGTAGGTTLSDGGVSIPPDTTIFECNQNGSWPDQPKESCETDDGMVCDDVTGTCVTSMLHPRDATFEVVPTLAIPGTTLLGEGPPSPSRSTQNVLDLATGFQVG